MPLFRFKAIAPTGETLIGEMEASTRDEVVMRLQDAGNVPIEAREASSAGGMALGSLISRSPMNDVQIAMFTQQLGTLLSAGQPLDRALQMLSEQPDSEAGQRLIERIRDVVRGGGSLSSALEQQHGVFSRLYINMVRAGEVSGSLNDTLKRLAEYLERTRQLKSKVINALVYPAMLVGMVIFALITLMIYVVPKFEPIFEAMGDDLPFITVFVLFIAGILEKFWWLLGLSLVGGTLWIRGQFANSETRVPWDIRLLKLRFIGPLITKVETARLARTLGTLVKNGVPLLTALSISRNVLSNTTLIKSVDEAANLVKTGGGLAYSLGVSKVFPKLAIQMIAVGEEAGDLDGMLIRTADTFDDDVSHTTERLLSALVPAITAIMAVVVGMIMIAIILPILNMSDLIQ